MVGTATVLICMQAWPGEGGRLPGRRRVDQKMTTRLLHETGRHGTPYHVEQYSTHNYSLNERWNIGCGL